MSQAKLVVAIGGTLRDGSSTEAAMRRVLYFAEQQGARTRIFAGATLEFPFYLPGNHSRAASAGFLVESLRAADSIIIGSPGYHGGISGLVKNALDYAEEMAHDSTPYLTGRAVGCVASGSGWQGCNSTLHALRSVVHALRGWPTPLGIAFNSAPGTFDAGGKCTIPQLDQQFEIMAEQLMQFGAETAVAQHSPGDSSGKRGRP
jgi:FMN reductase